MSIQSDLSSAVVAATAVQQVLGDLQTAVTKAMQANAAALAELQAVEMKVTELPAPAPAPVAG